MAQVNDLCFLKEIHIRSFTCSGYYELLFVISHISIDFSNEELLLKIILNRGYKAGFAKDGNEIIAMLSNDQYDVVLTNGGYKELNSDECMHLRSSSVFIVDIKDSRNQNQDEDLKADLCLPRPLLISELWQALEKLL